MNAINDTLRLAHRWRDAGVPEDQADKMIAALSEELKEGVASKEDIAMVRRDLEVAVRDLKIWTGSVGVVLFAALTAIRYFG